MTQDNSILHPLSIKYGYNSVQAFVDGSQAKFSLLTTGILDGPSTRLLLINVSVYRFGISSHPADQIRASTMD